MKLFDAEKYRGKRVIVALSGGVDSVCLLHSFREQAGPSCISLSALHIEHGIRGEESVRDMQFCKALCSEWGIPLVIRSVDVPRIVAEQGGNLEETARSVRYSIFESMLEKGDADFVATAHHAEDVAETVLFRLARGTGISGMRAITEYGGIVRPLLTCTRAEIEAYAAEYDLPHVEDSTNADENYTRNYIRRTVLPAFEKIHGGATRHLVEFAALAAEEDAFLQRLAEDAILHIAGEEWVSVRLPEVLFARACLCCMRPYAREGGYSRANIGEIEKLIPLRIGTKVSLPVPYGTRGDLARYAVREREHIAFYWEEKDAPRPPECPFRPEAGLYASPAPFAVREIATFSIDLADLKKTGGNTRELTVDLDAFPEGCVVRTRREGDMITPYHAPRRTLKKFLTDRKISARLGRKLPVIAKGSEVYAVVGVELSDSVKVTENTVRRGVIG